MVRPRLAFAIVLSALLTAQAALAGINVVGAELTSVPPKPEYMATGDLNGDGRQDVVVISPSSKEMTTYLGDNTPSNFGPARVVRFGNTLRGLAIGDVNRDDKLDVVVADQAAQGVWILLGKKDGTYQEPYLIDVPNSRNPYAVAIANWDQSGAPDLAVADRRVSKVFILLNDNASQPRFRRGGDFTSGEEPNDIRAVDMNHDGIPDIVTLNLGGARVKDVGVVLWKRVVQGFPEFETPQKYTVGEHPSELVVADFNKDGNADLAMFNRPSGGTSGGNTEIDVLLNQGGGVLIPPVSFTVACPFFTGGAPCRSLALAAGDIDGNGTVDLMVAVTDPRRSRGSASSNADAMQAFGGRGDGGFVPGPVFSIQKSPQSMAAADVTGDGKIDITIANQRTLSLQAFVNVSSPGGTANGELCDTGDECLSTLCTNGVCCGAACDADQVCNVPGREGVCIPESIGRVEPCIQDGSDVIGCSEAGAFCIANPGHGLCFPSTSNEGQTCSINDVDPCDGDDCTDRICCDQQCTDGRCNVPGLEGRCIPGIPPGQPCAADNQCTTGFCSDNLVCCKESCDGGFCDQFGICSPRTGNGGDCNEDSECQSSVCDIFDLICCNRICDEATEVCRADGTCGSGDPTPQRTVTPEVSSTPTPTGTARLTPGVNGEECSLDPDCSSTFCVNNVCCVERTCGGDAHCESGTGECASGGTPTRTPTVTPILTSTRLPVTPTVNPCSPNPCNKGQKCIANNGQAQCVVTSSSGGCATGGDAGSDSNLLVAAMLPLALWFGRRAQLKRATIRK
ncbi:MAG: VCBS repeat-containing protein [bacterium]